MKYTKENPDVCFKKYAEILKRDIQFPDEHVARFRERVEYFKQDINAKSLFANFRVFAAAKNFEDAALLCAIGIHATNTAAARHLKKHIKILRAYHYSKSEINRFRSLVKVMSQPTEDLDVEFISI